VIGLDYLVDTIAKLSKRVDLVPSFQWGTVTSASPVRVRLDGMSEPLAGPVDALVAPPEGKRVLVMVWNRRAIIMGAWGGAATSTWVKHGSNAFVRRPDAPMVWWCGSVRPEYMQPQDIWYEPGK
jgi:hypothetical protein